MKLVFAIAGDYTAQAIQVIQPKKTVSLYEPLILALQEVFKISEEEMKKNEPFLRPFELQAHHLRNVFSKMNAGIVSIHNFIGKQIHSPQEMFDYLLNVVIAKSLGSDWLVKKFMDDYIYQKDIFYVVTDFEPYVKFLKEALRSDLILLSVSSEEPLLEIGGIKVDHPIKVKSKTDAKRILTQTLSRMKGDSHGRNERLVH